MNNGLIAEIDEFEFGQSERIDSPFTNYLSERSANAFALSKESIALPQESKVLSITIETTDDQENAFMILYSK